MKTKALIGLICLLQTASGVVAQETAVLREATMPIVMSFGLEGYGQTSAQMEPPSVNVGQYGDPLTLSIKYVVNDGILGGIDNLQWSGSDQTQTVPSPVRVVISGPEGLVWRSLPVPMTVNRNGPGVTTDGYKRISLSETTQTLFSALEQGGDFTFSLEDESGRKWGSMRSVLPSSAERQRLFEANLAKSKNRGPQLLVPTPAPRRSTP